MNEFFSKICGISLTGVCFLTGACDRLEHVGRAPEFSSATQTDEHSAMLSPGLPISLMFERIQDAASLWSGTRQSLLRDRRAIQRGDIMTVVIEIDDKAEISNASGRSRSEAESLSFPQLVGLPQ